MDFIALICVVTFVWLVVCAARIISKEIACKDCIMKHECKEHFKRHGTTFCDDNTPVNPLNNCQNPFMI